MYNYATVNIVRHVFTMHDRAQKSIQLGYFAQYTTQHLSLSSHFVICSLL